MNRQDLTDALNAVIPHIGSTELTAFVGLESRGDILWAYATDRYTVGMARIDNGPTLNCHLSPSEAKDLLRFVRPSRKAHEVEEVEIALGFTGETQSELHVGLSEDSAVFDLVHSPLHLLAITEFIERLYNSAPELQQCVYQPSLLGRFAKAQRGETDVLALYPRQANDVYGAAVVTVGDHFIGGVSGLTYRDVIDPIILLRLGLTKVSEAA